MAKPGYVTITPSSGQGNRSNISVVLAAHTGRGNRSGTAVVAITGKSANVGIVQTGKPLFVSSPSSSYSSSNISYGGNSFEGYRFNITTNAKSLSVAVPQNSPLTIKGLSGSVGSGTTIDGGKSFELIPQGDPGNDNEYTVEVVLEIESNPSATSRYYDIAIVGTGQYSSDMASMTVRLNQDAGAIQLKVKSVEDDDYFSPDGEVTTINFSASGETKYINIESNTSWTIT